jgi:serine/threonine protein kinase
MSPEQLQAADDLDARADIWALGVVLYELVTGRVPFDAEDLPQLCVAILTKPPVPLTAVKPDAPAGLEQVIARCLQKDRADRYPNVAELAQDLNCIWQGEPPSRVMNISRVVREGPGQQVSALLEAARQATEDHVVAVFTDDAGKVVDQMEFVSIDEAFEYTSSLEGSAVRCDLYDEFAGVRGRLRVSYVRSPDTSQWVTLDVPLDE